MSGALSVLVDLVLPSRCAGCGVDGAGQLCPACRTGLASLVPTPTAPSPAPRGLPPCVALGAYEGPLRGLILGYKERGAHRLAGPLAGHLARAVALRIPAGTPILVIPVPATAAAIRDRHGDHMTRISRPTVRVLQRSGLPAAMVRCLTARPKSDSSHLSAMARAEAAVDAFRVRARTVGRVVEAQRAGAAVIVVDDILTTGATMAAVASVLASAGVAVDGAATLAATRRRSISPDRGPVGHTGSDMGFSP